VNTYETINYWASMYASVACLAFVIAYSVLAPWWKTSTGRMVMMLVGGLAGLAALTLIFAHYKDANTVRAIRAGLVTLVGTSLWWQVGAVIKVQTRRRKSRRDDE
jgi:hypothetical protein